MKITDITYDCVEVPFPREFHPTWYPGRIERGQVIFVTRVHTDEGITGYACMEAPHGILSIVRDTMEYAKTMVVGDSPFDIEKLMLKLRNVARIATRPWVIENACWDIIGKAAGLAYLWNAVRVQGGAYGVGVRPEASGTVCFWSFRDPGAVRSLGCYRQAAPPDSRTSPA